MPMYTWSRPPTPFARTDSEDNDSLASWGSTSPRSSVSSQFSDSWTSDTSSRRSHRSERFIPPPPPPQAFSAQFQFQPQFSSPPPPPRHVGYITPPSTPPSGPQMFPVDHYTPSQPHSSYGYPYSPRSDHGSISSRRSASSIDTPARSAREQERVEEYCGDGRTFDSILCQVCLQLPAVCTCRGGEEALLMMRRGVYAVYRRGNSSRHAGLSRRAIEPQIATPASTSVYAQGYEQSMQYVGGQMAYAGSHVVGYPGVGYAMEGYAMGYPAPPMFSPSPLPWAEQ